MTDPARPSYHALLVGIDAYAHGIRPLHGCVNDIDAVQRLLLDKVGIPPDRICRLASPHLHTQPHAEVPAQPATLANLRAALVSLAERAKEGDRVFIYYSGHGTRARLELGDGRVFYRESLVPVDFDADHRSALLFDYELNRLLADIAARTRSVAVVLDCCHSAGVTRDAGGELRARSFDLEKTFGPSAPLPAPTDGEPDIGPGWSADDCLVVSACFHYEQAVEDDGDDGITHGLLTRAFVRAVLGATDVAPRDLAWARLWQAMRAEVEERNPLQHLWMSGNPARAVFAGPPMEGDAGFSVQRDGDGYELGAGSLALVTDGARVAVYGDRPTSFPPIGSVADLEARHGLLLVTGATASSATARAEHAPFIPPPGARGRLVAAGKPARLRCAVVPANAKLVEALGASPLLEVVEPARSQVRLARADGRWLLADDLHGENPTTALFALTEHQLDRVRDVLEHYFRYALPLRMAESVGNAGMLQLHVLACPHRLSPAAAQEANLPEAPTAGRSAYDVPDGFQVCFRVRNTSNEQLRVTLVNSAASGRVQFLGAEIIEPRAFHVFWATLGTPFAMQIPAGRRQSIDRLTVIGTNALTKGVDHLRLDHGFAQVFQTTRAPKEVFVSRSAPPAEQWTATQAIVKTRAR